MQHDGGSAVSKVRFEAMLAKARQKSDFDLQ